MEEHLPTVVRMGWGRGLITDSLNILDVKHLNENT
jgi:hypothetical protein